MKKYLLAAALFPALAASVFGQSTSDSDQSKSSTQPATSDYQRPDAKKRQKRFVDSVVGPLTLARVAAGSAIGTFRNEPEEWEKNGKGFAKRFGSNFAQNAIRQSIVFGLDEAFKIDSSFYRSKKRDLGSKVGNALLSTVTARNERGKRVLGAPRIVGAFAAPVIARETWYPKRYDYKDGLRSGAISLGINAAVNLFRELIKK